MDAGSRVLGCLTRLIGAGESSRHLKPNCLKFLVCLKYVKAWLEDNNNNNNSSSNSNRSGSFPSSSSSLEMEGEGGAMLEKAVAEANVLMETSGSKIYRVWRCQSLTLKFEHVTLRIEDAIRRLCRRSSSHDPDQSQRARNCLLQLQRTNYFVDISEERLAEEIRFFLSEQRPPSLDKLQKLASKLDIRCDSTLAKELEALEKEEQGAKDLVEKQQIRNLITLFSRLQPSPSSESMHTRTTSWGISIPADFRCPLSLELMVDPVIVASGQTYERAYIQRWLEQGNSTCPKTRQPLSHDNLIPNYTVKALITSWCEANNITPPGLGPDTSSSLVGSSLAPPDDWLCSKQPRSLARSFTVAHSYPVRQQGTLRRNSFQCNGAGEEVRHQEVEVLVSELNSACKERRAFGAAQLRLLAKDDMRNRIVIAEAGGIKPLITLLNDEDEQVQENAVTAVLNLSINDNNKSEIAQAGAIQPLVKLLKEGTPVSKENAAATLFSLSVVEDNKAIIGAAGAVPPLVTLLETGSPRGKKDAATALFNLSISHENKSRIVRAGAIRPLVELLGDPALGMVDKAVAILANLTTTAEGRVGIGEEGGITALVEVLEAGTPRGKENAAAALLQLCINSSKHRALVLQEGAIPPLHALSQTGTPRAKDKALSLLRHFREQRAGRIS